MFKVIVNGSEYEVAIEEFKGKAFTAPAAPPTPRKPAIRPTPPAPASPKRSPQPAQDSSDGTVVAQMPGTIVDIHVDVGDKVERGQNLMVLEAMKMANQIVAPTDGIISEISVIPGALVNTGDALIVLG
jgi:biotin carboxyl carrier protein